MPFALRSSDDAAPPLLAMGVAVVAPLAPPAEGPEPPPADLGDDACAEPRDLVLPTGEPPALDCDQARRIVSQARVLLATPAETIDKARFLTATSDWLDPHGLWSVAPDAPVNAAFQKVGAALIAEIEQAPGAGSCAAAEEVGALLAVWVDGLRVELQAARTLSLAQPADLKRRWEIASSTPFEDGTVTRRARSLARLLGHGAGLLEKAYGEELHELARVGIERVVPQKTAHEWSRIVLAAAVRAYLPQLDPHGAWAPLDEETSIYDLDLEVDPPARLWSEMTRTTLGARVDAGAKAPLRNGDVVLRVGAVAVAGMSVEQANQLAVHDEATVTKVSLLRQGSTRPVEVEVAPDLVFLSPPPSEGQLDGLHSSEVSYGSGYALVVRIGDVPDDLGERLSATIFGRKRGAPQGVLLDLRGNGGGSTDGALGALGIFLPGASLFPMKRRGGEVEIDRAPRLPDEQVWRGPVAALVDGDSASAAEMIAGALASYDRGVVLGSKTYGKGCAQEYLDDEAGVGVLRLTTLVFALPDGSPLQRVGVSPHIALGLPQATEKEANLMHAPISWRGPDVRDKARLPASPWPDNGGRVGQSSDETVYRALRALGASRAAAR